MKRRRIPVIIAILIVSMCCSLTAYAEPDETTETAGITAQEYTKVKVIEGLFGAETTVQTNDEETIFDITFEAFDELQEVSGTVENGVVTVEYDATGFMAGDAQSFWDNALASDVPWEVIGETEETEGTEETEAETEVAVKAGQEEPEDQEAAIPAGNGCEKRDIITGEDGRYRLIVTSDAEVDDFNSFLMLLLFANDFDIDGIVYSSSWCHWNGDGEHTQGEINPSINGLDKCEEQVGIPAVELKEYRPMDLEWFQNAIDQYYRADYEYLVQNDPRYPEPDDLLSKVKIGNVEFQGDVRFDTEGSDLIKEAILDDDERTLFISNWGGFNTTCRALLSIYEEYGDSPEWEEMERHIGEKVIMCDMAQDNSVADNHIRELYPHIQNFGKTGINLGYFRGNSAPEKYREYFKSEQMCKNFLFDHGEIMGHQYTMGDGQVLKGELDQFQYGLTLEVPNLGDRKMEKYDHLAWTDIHEWVLLIPCGLRGLENGNLGSWGGRLNVDYKCQNRSGDYSEYDPEKGKMRDNYGGQKFMGDLLAEFVARADWAARSFDECNHAPVLQADSLDLTASAGDTVTLHVDLSDPDGDVLDVNWMVYNAACEYYGTERDSLAVNTEEGITTETASENTVTIPADAQPGDYIVVICRATDESDAPMTRYAEFVIEIR